MENQLQPENAVLPDFKFAGKKRYPFRLATTSFIYRAGYVENVRQLGPHFDEIELLFFESGGKDSCPSQKLIDELGLLANDYDLTYNIHLPIDVSPGDPDSEQRRHALRIIMQFIRRTMPLSPTSFTLHLPYPMRSRRADSITDWRAALTRFLSELLEVHVEPDLICIENLDYPMEWLEELIERNDLRICFDIGHMLVQKQALGPFFQTYKDRIKLIHLHGVSDTRDHLALDCLDEGTRESVLKILRSYSETVSLEVFSRPDLKRSLAYLEKSGLARRE